MDSASAAAITSSVLLLVSEILPFIPGKANGIVQTLLTFVQKIVVPGRMTPTGHTGQIEHA